MPREFEINDLYSVNQSSDAVDVKGRTVSSSKTKRSKKKKSKSRNKEDFVPKSKLKKKAKAKRMTILSSLKSISFLAIILLTMYAMQNPSDQKRDIVFYAFISLFAFTVIADVIVYNKTEKKTPIFLLVIGAGIIYLLLYFAGDHFGWVFFAEIQYGTYLAYLVFSLVVGKFSADMTSYFILSKSDARRQKKKGLDYVLNENKYFLSTMALVIALGLVTAAMNQTNANVWYYIVAVVCVIPLVVSLIVDLQKASGKTPEMRKEWIKNLYLPQIILDIVGALGVFSVLVFYVWDQLSTDAQGMGFQNWLIFSTLAGLGALIVIHTLLEPDLILGMGGKSARSRADGKYSPMDSTLAITINEGYLFTQAVMLILLGLCSYLLAHRLKIMIDASAVTTWDIFSLGINAIIVLFCFSSIQYFYAVYCVNVKGKDAEEIDRTLFIMGNLLLFFTVLGSIVEITGYSFFEYTALFIFPVVMVMGIFISSKYVSTKKVTETIARRSDGNGNKKNLRKALPFIIMIFGGGLLVYPIYTFVVGDAQTLLMIVLNILMFVIGITLIIGEAFVLIKQRGKSISLPKSRRSASQSADGNAFALINPKVMANLEINEDEEKIEYKFNN